MRKFLLLFSILVLSLSADAATPITCSALSALGYNYVYTGFSTSGTTDTFRMALSTDGRTWVDKPATWPTCGNGTPCAVNAPSALEYTDSITNVCHVYLLLAEANDAGLNSTKQDIGVLNDDYSVTTLLTFDWASIGGVNTVFAGRWNKVPGFTNCFVSPVDVTGGYTVFRTYAACAALTPTSASITSGPTLLTIAGTPTGYQPGYDPQIIQTGSTYNLVQTQTNGTLSIRITAVYTSSSLNGTYNWQTNAFQFNSPLTAQRDVSTNDEGPNYINRTAPGTWYFWFENVNTHQMYYSNCSPSPLSACRISTPMPWIEPMLYKNGTILNVSTTPLAATTKRGGETRGSTLQ